MSHLCFGEIALLVYRTRELILTGRGNKNQMGRGWNENELRDQPKWDRTKLIFFLLRSLRERGYDELSVGREIVTKPEAVSIDVGLVAIVREEVIRVETHLKIADVAMQCACLKLHAGFRGYGELAEGTH